MADRPALRAPRPEDRPPPPTVPPERSELDVPDDEAPLPDDLFDREWPDDDEDDEEGEGLVPDALAEPTLGFGGAPDDELSDEGDDPLLPPGPSLDELDDLGAPDDTEVPVLDPELVVRIDGRSVPARVEWGRQQTLWLRDGVTPGLREVALEVAGQKLPVRIEIAAADQEIVLLGRDLLKGRFLLRP